MTTIASTSRPQHPTKPSICISKEAQSRFGVLFKTGKLNPRHHCINPESSLEESSSACANSHLVCLDIHVFLLQSTQCRANTNLLSGDFFSLRGVTKVVDDLLFLHLTQCVTHIIFDFNLLLPPPQKSDLFLRPLTLPENEFIVR